MTRKNGHLAAIVGAAIILSGCAAGGGPSAEEIRAGAEAGDPSAQAALASDYFAGRHVTQSYSEAAGWYAKAAEAGDETAQDSLGNLYLEGLGVPKDPAKAVELYRKAAAQGFAAAENSLGMMFELGLGVARDMEEANQWYLKAARHGIPESMLNLGLDYHDGAGVPRDPVEAYKWVNLARFFTLHSSDKPMKSRIRTVLDKLKSELSKEELEEGQERSREWYDVYQES
jgi:TPR repeat protein